MLFQINDRDKDPMGILQVSSPVKIDPEELQEIVENHADHSASEMYNRDDDPHEFFWDSLIATLEELGLTAERVFMEEINL